MSKKKKKSVSTRKKLQKKATRFVEKRIVNFIATFLYILGLSLLLPLWTYLFYPEFIFSVKFAATLILAISLIFAAKWLLEQFYRKKKDTYRQLAIATLLPVALALILVFVSVDFFFTVANLFVPRTDIVQPIVETFIENKVPKVASVTFAYAVIGLYWLQRYRGRR